MGLRPINSNKHEVSWSNLASDASTTVAITLAIGVDSADADAASDVEVGSVIKSFYFEFNVGPQVTTNPKIVHWEVGKRPYGNAIPIPSLYFQDGRNHIFKRGMEMLPSSTDIVYKRIFVVRVPKGHQRVGSGDIWQFQYIATSAETINMCGFVIYKTYK